MGSVSSCGSSVRWCEEVRLCRVTPGGGLRSRDPVRLCRSTVPSMRRLLSSSSMTGGAANSASCRSASRARSRELEREWCLARGSSWIVFESFRRCLEASKMRSPPPAAADSCESVRVSRVPPVPISPSSGVLVAVLRPDVTPERNPLALSADGSSSNTAIKKSISS